jgi:hypothetical protein
MNGVIVPLGTYVYDRPSKRFWRYLNVADNVTIYILKELLGDPPPAVLDITAHYDKEVM